MRSSATGASFLVIGCGSIGKRHIRNLLTLGVTRLLAFDPRAERRAEIARELGLQTIPELEQAWRSQPEAALIATPTNLYLSLAIEAARHGCHLLIEKPLADRLDGVMEILAEALKADDAAQRL